MASIRKELVIDAHPDLVWDALRDWGAVHQRLAPGFVTAAELDGEDRIVTFFNGAVAREMLVDRDEQSRRLVWAIHGGSLGLKHYNAAAQVHPEGDGRTRFVWICDLIPNELAPTVEQLMERSINTIKRTMEGRSAA
jgi:carbon monoxide dehydrogenase subunit G